MNLKRPEGVVMAVVRTSSWATGFRWQMQTNSIFERVVQLWRLEAESCKCGIGLRWGSVAVFRGSVIPTWSPVTCSFLQDHMKG